MLYKKSEAKAWARQELKGHWSSLATPFTPDDRVDTNGLRHNIEYVLKLGTRGIGFTWLGGEFWSMTIEERKSVCETAVSSAKGQVPIGIHATALSVGDTVELCNHAEEAGADIVILSPPYVTKTDDQVFRYFENVASKVNIGIAILNSPFMGMLLSAPAIAKLATIPNVCAIKEASYPVEPLLVLEVNKLAGDKIVVSSPYDEAFFFEQYTGFHQQVMFANPQDWMFDTPEHNYYVQFINLATSGKSVEAGKVCREKVWPFREILDRHWHHMLKKYNRAFPAQVFKGWGEVVGLAAGHVRPPIMPMTEEEKSALRQDLMNIGRLQKVDVKVEVRR